MRFSKTSWITVFLCTIALSAGASTGFMDAGQRGTFNVGQGRAILEQRFDEDLHREILEVSYSISGNSCAGVWSKQYPDDLAEGLVDRVDVTVRMLEKRQIREVAVCLETKGNAGIQRFDIPLSGGVNRAGTTVDWNRIGRLEEVVLLIRRTGGEDPAVGNLQFAVDFSSMSRLEKFNASLPGRLSGAFIAAVLAMLFGLLKLKPLPGPARDIVRGLAVTLFAALVFGIYRQACSPFCFALAGAAAGTLLKWSMTGKSLTGSEGFQNALFTGLLAASASSIAIWQAPGSPASFFHLSLFGAALFVFVYHGVNAYLLAVFRKHIDPIAGLLITITPFSFGLLLALQTADHIWTQAVLIFAFGQFVANGIHLVVRRSLLDDIKVHVLLAAGSVAVACAAPVADFGSRAMPQMIAPFGAVAATLFSQAPLWGMVFMLTGMVIDSMHGIAPRGATAQANAISGAGKGAVYSGVLMGLIQVAGLAGRLGVFASSAGWVLLITLAFPLFKTIIETFDGSYSFFGRARRAYGDPVLYARGLVVGLALAFGLNMDFPSLATIIRICCGAVIGAFAFGGISLARDLSYGFKSWRYYLVEVGLGGFIGGALGFYFDASQIPIIKTKLQLYNSLGMNPEEIVARCRELRTTAPNQFTALVSRWGHVSLSPAAGGAKILFNEALMGVIGWGIAAPLFAVNMSFLKALLDRDASSIRKLLSREGMIQLVEGIVRVLRWGLWMAPIIFTFLRPMAEATWYNQDGFFRTCFAVVNDLARDSEGFTAWSLMVFSWIIGYGWFQVLIWIDHMGLRVATLVNFSFIGMDRLERHAAGFVGRDATARVFPEAVKRFTTWAPLLIPFYLPGGENWDQVFNRGLAMGASTGKFQPGWISAGILFAVVTVICFWMRRKRERFGTEKEHRCRIGNIDYHVEVKNNGEVISSLPAKGFLLNRPAFEQVDPAGRILFVVEVTPGQLPNTSWPIIGNFPCEQFEPSHWSLQGDSVVVENEFNQVRSIVRISLPGHRGAVELWEVRIEDLSGENRDLRLVPYLEWLLNDPGSDRNHTQYNRLYPEISYNTEHNALIALHRSTKLYGILASSSKPRGILSGRVDFIGRAGSVWNPRALQTLGFREALNMDAYPTFDPVGTMLLDAAEPVRLLMGCSESRTEAVEWISKYLQAGTDPGLAGRRQPAYEPLIGHGEVLPGTPGRYTEWSDNGRVLRILTPFTPRPFDHTMTNALGHTLAVTNRGLHCSTNGNAQQNRLTPDWADLVGAQMPSEAIYLYDPENDKWFSPTYDPVKDADAEHEAHFGLDGTAVFNMKNGDIETELSTHVPLDNSAGVYLLTIRNRGSSRRMLRVAPYFQIVLGHSPEMSGRLKVDYDGDLRAFYFENPRNTFRSGPCFVAVSTEVESHTSTRGEFFGEGHTRAHPAMVASGAPATGCSDDFPVAAFTIALEIPAAGEKRLSVVLGQCDTRQQANVCLKKFQSVKRACESLQDTRAWWLALQSTLELRTSDPEFDSYVNWLKYQTLAERIWARKGFYQASGAFGFRDQLQDTVNMIWVDPRLARKQIVLHAGQQFTEGDVAHWFFCLQDGRSGFLCRSHASDNPLWLAWAAAEYVCMTGDNSLLDEHANYLLAETPQPPLPAGKDPVGFMPLRSPKDDTIFKHVLKAVDMVLEQRIGPNGLPLIGTGDWNDGLDEIGSEGRGESVWLAFFLVYILKKLLPVIEKREGAKRREHYESLLRTLAENIETTWRGDRYLRAIHDDGTEIGVKGAGYWETDALGAAWAVYADINPKRGRIALDTALKVLEDEKVISLGYPPLREDIKPYLGRSSHYPEGVRENGMYSHGVQWLTRACRLLSERFAARGDSVTAQYYRDACSRIWYKISAIPHTKGDEIEVYGGQPNKQCADYLTRYDPGRMIWNGYTGAAGWMMRQACESVIGARLENNEVVLPADADAPRGKLMFESLKRDVGRSPFDDRNRNGRAGDRKVF